MTATKKKETQPDKSKPDAPDGDRAFVIAFARGLNILDCFADGPIWLSNGEVARAVDLPRPTVSRLLHSLEASGYLYYSASQRKFRLAPAVLALGFGARAHANITERARPHLRKLADEFGVHVSIAIRDRLDLVLVEVVHSNATMMTLQLEVGSRIPLAGTSSGHAILAALPDSERSYLFDHLRKRHAKHWDEIRQSIERGIKECSTLGYTSVRGAWMIDLSSVAAPLASSENAPVMAISCGAPGSHLSAAKIREIGKRLSLLAAELRGH